jgi:hypothetical protein
LRITHRHRQQKDSNNPFPNQLCRVIAIVSHTPISDTELPGSPVSDSRTNPGILVLAIKEIIAALNNELLRPTIKIAEISVIVCTLYDSVHEITQTVDTVGRIFQTELNEARRLSPTIRYIVGEVVEPVEERGDDSIPADGGLIS